MIVVHFNCSWTTEFLIRVKERITVFFDAAAFPLGFILRPVR